MNDILSKLGAVRTRIRMLIATNAAMLFLAVGGGVVAGSFVLDFIFQLPLGARTVMLVLMGGVMIWGAARFFFQPQRVKLSDDAVALWIEQRRPEFGDELISAVQLSRMLDVDNGESRELMQQAVDDAAARFKREKFTDTVGFKSTRRPALFGIGALLLVLGYSQLMPAHASLWVDRVLLLRDRPWPPKTRLTVQITNIQKLRHEIAENGSHDVYLPENAPLRIEVTAEGEVPSSVRIHKKPLDSDEGAISIEMAGRDGSAEFEYKFGRVTSSFSFHVVGGDDNDRVPFYRIHVRSAPRVGELLVDYDYPQYVNDAGEADRSDVREYNIVGPVGTEVTMRFVVSHPLTDFSLILDDDPEAAIKLRRTPGNDTEFANTFILNNDHFYTWKLIGKNGAPSREAPDFNISAQPDLPPDISIALPEVGALDVTDRATVPVKLIVSDDYRVGPIQLTWDTSRDGAFAGRLTPSPDNVRFSDDGRQATAFVAVDLRQLKAIEEGQPRALHAGDVVYFRIAADDTRKTESEPKPNRSVYPSLVSLQMREPVEIERELMRTQVRLKNQIQQAQDAVVVRLEDIAKAIESFSQEGSNDQAWTDRLNTMIAGQDLVTSSLSETARSFVRVVDGYLFNRMDPSNLTESLIGSICTAHRLTDTGHFEVMVEQIPRIAGAVDDGEAMGKLVIIMNLLLTASIEQSPAASKAIKNGLGRDDPEVRREALLGARDTTQALAATLDTLLEKMEEWEDFQDVIQSLKDIIDLEKGLHDRLKKIAR